MAKPFDPFAEDDDLEFQPDAEPTSIAPHPQAPDPQRDQATRILTEDGKRARKDLRLDFSELNDQGGDIRGASEVGSESLAGDEFLRGVKRKDYEDALGRAVASQSAPVRVDADEGRVVRKVKTPIYLLLAGMVAFLCVLAGLGFVVKLYLEHQDAEKVKALEQAKP